MGSAFRDRMLEATKENRRETLEIKRRIAKLYEQAAEDMASKAAASKSGGLTEAFARSLSHSLRERCKELWKEVGETTKAGMLRRAEKMVSVQTSFLADAARRAELNLKPTLARVFAKTSDEAVLHVLRGGIYGGKAPTLSKRIWNNAALQSGQIEEIIAGGIAKKQSAIQLARSLQAYLNPNVLEPDTWNETYPNLPFTLKVDYNAKRLAVTSINHAGWGATLMAARSNPYADFLHWELTPAHVINDVCDGYAGHDEGLGEGNWNLDAAPLPHPWCTCLWYVDTSKTLDEIAKELKAWEDGESNPRLDEAFGKWENTSHKITRTSLRFGDTDDISILNETEFSGSIDKAMIEEVKMTVNRIKKDFPILNIRTVLFGNEPGIAAARTDGEIIRLDHKAFQSLQTAKKVLETTVKSGHTVNADNPMFIVAHEIGHCIHFRLAIKRSGFHSFPDNILDCEKIKQELSKIVIDFFASGAAFGNESFNEIYNMIEKEMGTRSLDGNEELVAQAVATSYYGNGTHPISDALVSFLKKECEGK